MVMFIYVYVNVCRYVYMYVNCTGSCVCVCVYCILSKLLEGSLVPKVLQSAFPVACFWCPSDMSAQRPLNGSGGIL